METLGSASLMSFLVDTTSPLLPQLAAGGIQPVLCDSAGRGLLEACVWFSLDFAPRAFPLC